MHEYISFIALIIAIAALLSAEKLRKRLNLTQDLLIKNYLVKGDDFIPGYRQLEDERKTKMTKSEKEAAAIVEKMIKK